MNNNILTDGIRLDGEYKELLKVLKKVSQGANPQPILLTGLCEGAADAAYASLIFSESFSLLNLAESIVSICFLI